jgi:hypothetical protein
MRRRTNPFDNTAPNNLFISPHLGKWDPIADDSHSTSRQEDIDRLRQEDMDRLLKRQRRQNERDMQDIPGHVERKERNYAKLYAKERILERLAEPRQQRPYPWGSLSRQKTG